MSIFIYNIALQNKDFGVLQKSSKHFLIFFFFPPYGRGDIPSLSHLSALRATNKCFALFMTIHAPPFTKSWIRH